MTKKEQLNQSLEGIILKLVPMRENELKQFMSSNNVDITFMRMNGRSNEEIAEKLLRNVLKGV